MWKLAILVSVYGQTQGFPVSVMIFEPDGGLSASRTYASFSEAFVHLMREGWEPIHAEIDCDTLERRASFRMPAPGSLFRRLRAWIGAGLTSRRRLAGRSAGKLPAGESEFSHRLREAVTGRRTG